MNHKRGWKETKREWAGNYGLRIGKKGEEEENTTQRDILSINAKYPDIITHPVHSQ